MAQRGGDRSLTVCVVWRRFGPYHRARLQASVVRFAAEGVQLIGVEVASRGGLHHWSTQTDDAQIETLFPDQALESLPRRQVFRAMRGLLDRIDPDVIVVPAYSRPESQAGLSWARERRRVAIVMAESTRDDARRSRLRERLKRSIVSQFDAALAGGRPQLRYIRELGIPHERIFTPYDVVDNAFFHHAATAARADPAAFSHLPGLRAERPFFLACGRFIARKNYAALIEAYGVYRAADPDPWGLVILGDGPERARLIALADQLASGGGITFAGYHQIDEIAAYYGLAAAFIHPATVEPWGLVINEAMAAGLPVLVSSSVGAADDLVTDGVNGYVFDPVDPAAMAAAMRRVAAPGCNRQVMGARSREGVAQFSPQDFAEALWRAVGAGRAVAERSMPPSVRALIWANLMVPHWMLALRSVEQ